MATDEQMNAKTPSLAQRLEAFLYRIPGARLLAGIQGDILGQYGERLLEGRARAGLVPDGRQRLAERGADAAPISAEWARPR